MKIAIATAALLLAAGSSPPAALAAGGTGEELFKLHCTDCHQDGGNIVNPQKTLKKADREAHGIKTAQDIVKQMRNPGPGMTQFDTKTIPDKDAKAIADYVITTFK